MRYSVEDCCVEIKPIMHAYELDSLCFRYERVALGPKGQYIAQGTSPEAWKEPSIV